MEDHKDADKEENELDDPSIMSLSLSTGEVGDDLAETNTVFEKWMTMSVKFYDYLFDDAKSLVVNRRTCKVTFRDLIFKFDTMKYYRQSG